MCLVIDQKKPLIAKEDITVFKLMVFQKDRYDEYNTQVEGSVLVSFFEKFPYELKKLYKTKIGKVKNFSFMDNIAGSAIKGKFGFDWEIREDVFSFAQGFHSVTELSRLVTYPNTPVFECIIPAGSKYYTDYSQGAVSNQIIIVKQVK